MFYVFYRILVVASQNHVPPKYMHDTSGTKYMRDMPKYCLNFKSVSCKYKLMMENRFFGEDLTATKHEKVRFSLPAREPPNDPL